MRKFIVLLSFSLIVLSCNMYDDYLETDRNVADEETIYAVPQCVARILAEQTVKDKNLIEMVPVTKGKDTLLFICNFSDGWMVISGDKRTAPILGSNAIGHISSSEAENVKNRIWLDELSNMIFKVKKDNRTDYDEHNLSFWKFFENIASSQGKLSKPLTRGQVEIDTNVEGVCYWVKRPLERVKSDVIIKDVVPRLTKTKWGQLDPWNNGFPVGYKDDTLVNCPTGCQAVAMAQMLYYYHYFLGKPSGLFHNVSLTGEYLNEGNFSINFSRSNYVEDSPRWDLMALSKTDDNTDYVRDLMAEIGYRINLKYTPDGTGNSDFDPENFTFYGLHCEKDDYDYSLVKSNLKQGKPVMITAYANREHKGIWPVDYYVYKDGHAWVIDGLREKIYKYNHTYQWIYINPVLTPGFIPDSKNGDVVYTIPEAEAEYPEIYKGMKVVESTYSTTEYLLMNWGWSGGPENYAEYYPYIKDSWVAQGDDYLYKRTIFYNFTAI